MDAELVLDARNGVGESPVWVAQEQALYWVDIPARMLLRWQSADGRVERWAAPEMIGCIAPTANGEWICAMETGVFRMKPQAGGLLQGRQIAAVPHALPGMRFNDGRCDRQGRFRAGTMLMDMGAARAAGVDVVVEGPDLLHLGVRVAQIHGAAVGTEGQAVGDHEVGNQRCQTAVLLQAVEHA